MSYLLFHLDKILAQIAIQKSTKYNLMFKNQFLKMNKLMKNIN